MPRRNARFLLAAIPIALGAVAAGTIGLATQQQPWGDAEWDTAAPIEVTGVFRASPYPVVHERAEDGSVRSHLLVRVGKLGVADVLAGEDSAWLDGAVVDAKGWRLERDGRRILELDPAPSGSDRETGTATGLDAVRLSESPPPFALRELDLSGATTVTIVGEIVDAKCFLGAMKPGSGRGHKACATLCVQGGIPPVLFSIADDQSPRYHLLTDETGEGLTADRLEELLPLIGETVSITGVESRAGSWRVLRTTRGKVTPL